MDSPGIHFLLLLIYNKYRNYFERFEPGAASFSMHGRIRRRVVACAAISRVAGFPGLLSDTKTYQEIPIMIRYCNHICNHFKDIYSFQVGNIAIIDKLNTPQILPVCNFIKDFTLNFLCCSIPHINGYTAELVQADRLMLCMDSAKIVAE
jgi:hypothetical protein